LQGYRNTRARGRLPRVNTEEMQREHGKKQDGKAPIPHKDLAEEFSQGLYSDTSQGIKL